MNIFEKIREDEDTQAGTNKNLADAAVAEAREKIKDQILFLKLSSKDVNIRHHLLPINEENKEKLLDSIPDKDIIDFNEVILKGNWREYLERYKGEKPSKYNKETISEQSLVTKEKDEERLDPAKEFALSFQAMIKHYALNLEFEENEQKKESERKLLQKEFKSKLMELEKKKPHIVAIIEGIDLNILRKSDYEVAINLNEDRLQNYEEKLREYFDLKVDSTVEKRTKESKVEMIKKDPRFRYYCALREALEMKGPCSPEIFINL